MRVRAVVLSAALGLGAAVLVSAPATAAPAPSVTPVTVAGNGPLDQYRVSGSGFTPGHQVAFTLESDAASRTLGTFQVASSGSVSPPVGSRIPADVTPGPKTVRLTQDDGLTAESAAFTIDAPAMTAPSIVQSNSDDTAFGLTGLANTFDVKRALTVDGRPLTGVTWYYDDRSFGDPGVHAALPPLSVGDHTVVFTQTVRTPFTATATVRVQPATLTAPREAGIRQTISFTATGAGRGDVLAVTVVGAAQDRHPLGTIRVFDDHTTDTVTLDGVSPGQATATFVSRQTGGSSSATLTVLPTIVTAPAGLAPNGRLSSPDGWRRLVMQTDGNLVEQAGGGVVWNSRTGGHPGARLQVQSDGNLVVRGTDGRALWWSSTGGIGAGARLVVDSDRMTLTTASGRRVWSTNPLWMLGGPKAGEYLARGETREGDIAVRPSGPYGSLYLRMQADGNLTLALDTGSGSRVVWQTKTGGHPNAYAVLQSDGNFVVRGPDGRALWANNAHGGAGARIVLQADGNMVEYTAAGRAVWSTRTSAHW